ncbi:MAG TPA: hypothetical protein VIS09_04485 [Streptomyces sp.]
MREDLLLEALVDAHPGGRVDTLVSSTTRVGSSLPDAGHALRSRLRQRS